MKKIGVFVLLLFIGFSFCTKNPADESNTSTGNRAPVIVSMTAVPEVLNINMAGQVDSALVTVIATDSDDTSLTYTFNASLGKLSNQNGKDITYTPPSEEGDYVVSCTVSDGKASAVDSVSIQVLPPEPVLRIVNMTAVPETLKINTAGQVDSALVTVIINDFEYTSITYTFNADLGELSNQNGGEITYTPPAEQGNYVVSCTVSDGESTDIDSVSIQVLPPEPVLKVVNMTTVPDILKINMIGQVDSTIVTVIASDYDEASVTYTFNASLGKLSNQNGCEITYTPPAEEGSYVVSCTVSDCKFTDVDSVAVQVLPPDPLSKIAFIHHDDIYVINADGTNLTRLTNDDDDDKYSPSWSPDVTNIAFSAKTSEDGKYDIYIIDADGTNRKRLTYDGYSNCPSWSPDGSKIVFSSRRDGYQAIYIMNADGSNQKLIPNSGGYRPSWSPDGSKIAFDRGNQIYTMNTDGTDQICLTSNYSGGTPVWSPDGSKIAFISDIYESPMYLGIYIINADGSNLTRICKGHCSSWSPDGSRITFEFGLRLYIINTDGTNEIKLTDLSCSPSLLSWSKIIH